MKKQYTQPELYVENVVVESGIAQSFTPLNWGDEGYAGSEGSVENYGTTL